MVRNGWAIALLVGAVWSGFAFTGAADADDAKKESPKLGASIDGYRYEFPCKNAMPENPKPGADCDSGLVKGDPKKTDNFSAVRTFDGEKGKRYKVTLRFRGVVEPMMYKDGTMDGEYFYVGGEPNNNTYNIYKLTVSSPPSHFFLNRQDKVGHRIFTIDYQKTIEIEGGATITFLGDGQNGRLISNFAKLVVPDVAPAPRPFNGQFVQVNVVDVVEVKCPAAITPCPPPPPDDCVPAGLFRADGGRKSPCGAARRTAIRRRRGRRRERLEDRSLSPP